MILTSKESSREGRGKSSSVDVSYPGPGLAQAMHSRKIFHTMNTATSVLTLADTGSETSICCAMSFNGYPDGWGLDGGSKEPKTTTKAKANKGVS